MLIIAQKQEDATRQNRRTQGQRNGQSFHQSPLERNRSPQNCGTDTDPEQEKNIFGPLAFFPAKPCAA